MTITIGSLSSGYGGLEMALGLWLGAVDVRWHSEIDTDASRVLKTWWPEVPNLGSFADEDFWECAERVYLMCGGIPCQPFSAAGRQQGEADHRHLWPFWRRGIALHRPATIVFENVANLTRGKMRPIFDGIVADLLALGYDVRWCLLGACAVGAAHHRHRVFLLACRSRTTPHARQVQVATCGQKLAAYLPTPSAVSYGSNRGGGAGRVGPVRHSLDSMARAELLPSPAGRDGSTRGEGSAEFWGRRRELGGTRAVAGITLGAAVTLLATPQHRDGREPSSTLSAETAARREAAGRRNLEDSVALLPTPRSVDSTRGPAAADRTRPESNGQDLAQVLVALLPSPRVTDARNGGPNQGIASGDIALPSAVQPERWGRYAEAIARHETVLGRPAPEPTEIGPRGGRRLAAAFSEWLMMLPEGHLTSVLDRNPALARAGNGVVPLQAATALRLLFEDLVRRR
jgi:DNA (cytosine-5)-methyltransferase 1